MQRLEFEMEKEQQYVYNLSQVIRKKKGKAPTFEGLSYVLGEIITLNSPKSSTKSSLSSSSGISDGHQCLAHLSF